MNVVAFERRNPFTLFIIVIDYSFSVFIRGGICLNTFIYIYIYIHYN